MDSAGVRFGRGSFGKLGFVVALLFASGNAGAAVVSTPLYSNNTEKRAVDSLSIGKGSPGGSVIVGIHPIDPGDRPLGSDDLYIPGLVVRIAPLYERENSIFGRNITIEGASLFFEFENDGQGILSIAPISGLQLDIDVPEFSIALSNPEVLPQGVPVLLIENRGLDPIVGSIANLGEGEVLLSDSGIRGVISYAGGDGNDVTWTPTVVPEPEAGLLLLMAAASYGLRRRR